MTSHSSSATEPAHGSSLDYAEDLETTVRRVAARLRRVSDREASRRPGPSKWSAKEIIGHLVDSASNNHQRFVRAQWQDDLVFTGYQQELWVSSQRYQSAPWDELLDLWLAFNLHLARLMATVSDEVKVRVHTHHNLDELAFKAVAKGSPVTLDFFMRDYVDHLHHHLRQIEALGLVEG